MVSKIGLGDIRWSSVICICKIHRSLSTVGDESVCTDKQDFIGKCSMAIQLTWLRLQGK